MSVYHLFPHHVDGKKVEDTDMWFCTSGFALVMGGLGWACGSVRRNDTSLLDTCCLCAKQLGLAVSPKVAVYTGTKASARGSKAGG